MKNTFRVVCGVLLSVPETMEDLRAMKRLWAHETMRVYYDRLVYPEDRSGFIDAVKDICTRQLQIDFDELCGHLSTSEDGSVSEDDLRRLLMCDFSDPKNEDRFYKEIRDMDAFRLLID